MLKIILVAVLSGQSQSQFSVFLFRPSLQRIIGVNNDCYWKLWL